MHAVVQRREVVRRKFPTSVVTPARAWLKPGAQSTGTAEGINETTGEKWLQVRTKPCSQSYRSELFGAGALRFVLCPQSVGTGSLAGTAGATSMHLITFRDLYPFYTWNPGRIFILPFSMEGGGAAPHGWSAAAQAQRHFETERKSGSGQNRSPAREPPPCPLRADFALPSPFLVANSPLYSSSTLPASSCG